MRGSKIIITGLLLFLSLLANAQRIKKRNVEAFDKIRVFGNVEVEMIKGKKEAVEIFARNINLSDIGINVLNRQLKIKTKSNLFKEDAFVKLRVTYKEIREISVNASADIIFRDVIKNDKLFISATSGARANLKVNLNALELKVYQGAHIDISGSTKLNEVLVNTGGILSATYLACDEVFIKLNTGGQAEFIVNKSIDAIVNTKGKLNYFGLPEKENIKTKLGGSVNAWDKPEDI